ncbi:MAG TPA: hypothetical protein PLP27_08570 [Crocinitomicaceae bacterium]|nr:hypothetical protein [Crocinitomicaceae bacterium]
MKLLLFRRANKYLILEKDGKYNIVDKYNNEDDEMSTHLNEFKNYVKGIESPKLDGYFYSGLNDDILMFYVFNHIAYIEYDKIKYNISSEDTKCSCRKINEKNNEWIFECTSIENKFEFRYKSYYYDSFENESEEDANFGVWLLSLFNNPQKINFVINRFSE